MAQGSPKQPWMVPRTLPIRPATGNGNPCTHAAGKERCDLGRGRPSWGQPEGRTAVGHIGDAHPGQRPRTRGRMASRRTNCHVSRTGKDGTAAEVGCNTNAPTAYGSTATTGRRCHEHRGGHLEHDRQWMGKDTGGSGVSKKELSEYWNRLDPKDHGITLSGTKCTVILAISGHFHRLGFLLGKNAELFAPAGEIFVFALRFTVL
jgi:hypothetical protein